MEDDEGNIFALIAEECYYDDLWLETKRREEQIMNEILDFINENLITVMRKQAGRIDHNTKFGTKIKIYQCGKNVTRIDVVREEK